jgi:2'-5' RNA ligase
MPYAIELYLDNESGEKVQLIRDKLKEKGINVDEGARPHVSLAIYQDLNLQVFEKQLGEFAKQNKFFDIVLASIGIFATEASVVFLAPTVTSELLRFHKGFHDFFKENDNAAWDYYRPGKWVPHCTLAMDLTNEMVSGAVEIVRQFSLPIQGRVDRIGVLEFSPNKHLFEFIMNNK